MDGKKAVISTQNLTKRYNGKIAVNALNLDIEEGEIFGLLGPNGAGKTTTILMLLGLTEPDEGKAWIDGHDCTRNPTEVKRIVGYLPDNVGFYGEMTGRENLRFTGQLNGMGKKEIEERIEILAGRVGLADALDKKAGAYSRGMRQRLGIADVLMKNPRVVILDEPTLGIDPEGIRELFALITELSKKEGRTVLISSHLLHQVQKICDRVGIFVEGSLLAAGSIDVLGEKVLENKEQVLELKTFPDDEGLEPLLEKLEGVQEIRREKSALTVRSMADVRGKLSKLLSDNGYAILHMRLRGGDLDDIYRLYFSKEGVV